jgi:hypothetical protein
MAMGEHKNWRELCHAALEAKDPNELLEIVQDLNKALRHKEHVRRDFSGLERRSVLPVNYIVDNYPRTTKTNKCFNRGVTETKYIALFAVRYRRQAEASRDFCQRASTSSTFNTSA